MEPHLAEILESITDCFYALDREWRFTYVNARAEAYLGVPRAALAGRVVWDVFDAAAPVSRSVYEQAVRDGTRAAIEILSPATGRWVEVHVHPGAAGLSVSFRDISGPPGADAGRPAGPGPGDERPHRRAPRAG